MAKSTAAPADAGAAAPASTTATPVHTSAQRQAAKPAHHQPTPPRQRDQYTGVAGTYMRDPKTGERTPVKPEAMPAPGDDATAAA